MSKRLQVLFDPKEYKELAMAAKKSGLSIGEWVRQVVRASIRSQSVRPGDAKMKAIRALSQHRFPSGEINQILDQIEKGRGK